MHYCKIREATDFEALVNLIISDKIFETLDKDLSTHIAVREGESWLRPEDLAKQCDVYYAAKCTSFEAIKNEMCFVYQETVRKNSKYVPPPLRKHENTVENKKSFKSRE